MYLCISIPKRQMIMKYLDPKATAESGDVDYEYHHIIKGLQQKLIPENTRGWSVRQIWMPTAERYKSVLS